MLGSSGFKTVLILLSIMVMGVVLRLDDVNQWPSDYERAYYEGEPLLTNLDGYYYLRASKDFLNGEYQQVDMKRGGLEGLERGRIPLLSVLTVLFKKSTSLDLNWAGVLLPTILGVLLAVPIFLQARVFCTKTGAVLSAIIAITSTTYFVRTSVGWLDTDCMNVTFLFMTTYLFYRYAIAKNSFAFAWLGSAIFSACLFFWWWDMAGIVVIIMCLFPFLLACLYRKQLGSLTRFELYFFIAFFLCVILIKKTLFIDLLTGVVHFYNYLVESKTDNFPNVSIMVGEQGAVSSIHLIANLTDSYPAFIIGSLGLIWLMIREWKKTIFLFIPIVVGGFGLFYAQRYLLFFGPLQALGFGYLFDRCYFFASRKRFYTIMLYIGFCLIISITVWSDFKMTQWPKFSGKLVNGFKFIEENTDSQAIIWNWWDHGHPLLYYTDRKTLSDGANHSGEVSVYSSIPFVSESNRLAANFMIFYLANGNAGLERIMKQLAEINVSSPLEFIKKLLAGGPKYAHDELANQVSQHGTVNSAWSKNMLEKLFPSFHKDVYLFFDYKMAETVYWWYWLGTWNLESMQGVHTKYMPFYGIRADSKAATNNKDLFVNFETGMATLLDAEKTLRSASIYDINGLKEEWKYEQDAQAYFELFAPGYYGALMRKDVKESLYNRLFIRHERNSYFIPVKMHTPLYQLYKVKNDSIN